MRRAYLSDVTGDGTQSTPFTAVIDALLPNNEDLMWCDGRSDETQPLGRIYVEKDVSDTGHAAVIADPRVTYLPFEDVSGVSVADDVAVTMSVTKRNQLRAAFETVNVPMQDVASDATPRLYKRRMIKRFLLTRLLGPALAPRVMGNLDATLGSLTALQRTALRNRLELFGFDYSTFVNTTTIREFLRGLIQQDVPAIRSPY